MIIFAGREDIAVTYHWSQVSGKSGVRFSRSGNNEAKQSEMTLPERGKYVIACRATWRGITISSNVTIDTEKDGDDGAQTLAKSWNLRRTTFGKEINKNIPTAAPVPFVSNGPARQLKSPPENHPAQR